MMDTVGLLRTPVEKIWEWDAETVDEAIEGLMRDGVFVPPQVHSRDSAGRRAWLLWVVPTVQRARPDLFPRPPEPIRPPPQQTPRWSSANHAVHDARERGVTDIFDLDHLRAHAAEIIPAVMVHCLSEMHQDIMLRVLAGETFKSVARVVRRSVERTRGLFYREIARTIEEALRANLQVRFHEWRGGPLPKPIDHKAAFKKHAGGIARARVKVHHKPIDLPETDWTEFS